LKDHLLVSALIGTVNSPIPPCPLPKPPVPPPSGGDLFDYVVTAKRGRLDEHEARFYFQQLVCGVAWCHSKVRRWGRLGAVLFEEC